MTTTIILGCGYIGRRLARHYLDHGDQVLGIVRNPESAAALNAEGIPALALDLAAKDGGHVGNAGAVPDKAEAKDGGHAGNARPELLLHSEHVPHPCGPGAVPDKAGAKDGGHVPHPGVPGTVAAALDFAGTRVFHLAPPPDAGTLDLHTRHLVDAFAHLGTPARLVYISTTGVYGDCDGAWVDEDRPVQPQADRARRRWDAEQTLAQWRAATGAALVTLRVAGIYGPGRLPLERIRAGLPLVRPEDAPWSNRIHADDLVAACIAAMERGSDGAVYNACDGNPSTMAEYFFQVADAAGLPRPPVIALAEAEGRLSAGMLSYMRESRRLSNRRLVENLEVELRYPNLTEGLRSCF